MPAYPSVEYMAPRLLYYNTLVRSREDYALLDHTLICGEGDVFSNWPVHRYKYSLGHDCDRLECVYIQSEMRKAL